MSDTQVFNGNGGDDKNPSGAKMIERSLSVREMVRAALMEYPPGRGDDMLLYIYVLRKNYWRKVRVSTKNGGLVIDYGVFSNFLFTPCFETVRRRRQELQENERHAIERGDIKESMLLPSSRVVGKRARLENAYRNEFGRGQLRVSDYMMVEG